jgi:hypothetical protein
MNKFQMTNPKSQIPIFPKSKAIGKNIEDPVFNGTNYNIPTSKHKLYNLGYLRLDIIWFLVFEIWDLNARRFNV